MLVFLPTSQWQYGLNLRTPSLLGTPDDEESRPSSSVRSQDLTHKHHHSLSEVQVIWVTNWSRKPDLEAYGAPGGTVVFVLVVKLQMRNQQLVHSTGVTGRQTVQLTLETDNITAAATESGREWLIRGGAAVPGGCPAVPGWRSGRPPWATPQTALALPPQSRITDDQPPTGAQESSHNQGTLHKNAGFRNIKLKYHHQNVKEILVKNVYTQFEVICVW